MVDSWRWRIDKNWIKPGTEPNQVMNSPGIRGPAIGSSQRIYGRNRIGKPKGLCTPENQGAKCSGQGFVSFLLKLHNSLIRSCR